MSEGKLNGKYTEAEIVDRCKAGDMRAFKILYDSQKLKMYNIAIKIHGNREDAEDSVQEAFIQLYNKIGSFKGKSAFSTWFYRIVVNSCLNNLRKEKGKKKLDFSEDFAEAGTYKINQNVTLKMILDNEINNLPSGYRTVFTLYEIEGFSHKEIAEILKINEGTSKSQLHAAKSFLRKRLQPYRENLQDAM